MEPKLDISIIIPTRDSEHLLQRHVNELSGISSAAKETIVVDSSTNSQTLDFLKKHLPSTSTTYLTTPPGLYQAWNTAIDRASSKYCYIATSGDRIDLLNLKKLYQTAVKFDADITISSPTFIDEDGQRVRQEWAIHRYTKSTSHGSDQTIPPTHVTANNLLQFPSTLIGSSASNLYKSEYIKNNPFPTELGAQADSIWACTHSVTANWALCSSCYSEFVVHWSTSEKTHYSEPRKQQLLKEFKRHIIGQTPRSKLADLQISYINQRIELSKLREQLNQARKRKTWAINPRAWKLRREYKYHKNKALQIIKKVTSQ